MILKFKIIKNFLFIFILIFFTRNILKAQNKIDISKLDLNYYQKFKGKNMILNVYNWGEYISDGSDDSININKEFEELTGIKVNYSTFASNEELYVKLKVGGVAYDIIIPSDYMIAKLIKEGLIQKLNYKNIPLYTNIQPRFYNTIYDPEGEYSIAYTWGVNGIIYNKNLVEEENIDWDILFNDKYAGKILMYYNPRDAFGVAEAYLNYSLNTTNESELREAARILKEQKPSVQAYVMDEIYDKMEAEEAAIAVYYAGDSLTMMDNNPNLNFIIPKKGANLFVDALCIPSNAQNVEAAELYINFLCEGETALANIEYINYASPNNAAIEMMSEETKNNKIIYPPSEILDNCEVYITLPEETNLLMEELWNEILSTDNAFKGWVVPLSLAIIAALCIIIIILRKKKKRES